MNAAADGGVNRRGIRRVWLGLGLAALLGLPALSWWKQAARDSPGRSPSKAAAEDRQTAPRATATVPAQTEAPRRQPAPDAEPRLAAEPQPPAAPPSADEEAPRPPSRAPTAEDTLQGQRAALDLLERSLVRLQAEGQRAGISRTPEEARRDEVRLERLRKRRDLLRQQLEGP